jgi:predicted nucleic acid-binding protein
MMRLRVYVDASVIGGCLDEEFASESLALLEMARRGEIVLLASDLLTEELARAPQEVQNALLGVRPESVEEIVRSDESRNLRQAYLDAGVLPSQSSNDAHHVALATVARADVLVSWNFRHIVHLDKIRLFNAVNLREGYPLIDIRSPKEIV